VLSLAIILSSRGPFRAEAARHSPVRLPDDLKQIPDWG
jgi:hypothetical protein